MSTSPSQRPGRPSSRRRGPEGSPGRAGAALLGALAALTLAAGAGAATPGPGPGAGENRAPAACRALEAAGAELARARRRAETDTILELLARLGEDQRSLERLERRWARELDAAAPPSWSPQDALRQLERAVTSLAGLLEGASGEDERILARAILVLDDQHEAANRALGSSRLHERWMAPERAVLLRGAEALEGHQRWASSLSLPVEVAEDDRFPSEELAPGGSIAVSSMGITLHGRLPVERMRRMLAESLRACALSYAIYSGQRELPRFSRAHYWIVPRGRFREALDDAAAHGGVSPADVGLLSDHSSFADARGWYTCRWRSEAHLESLVLFDQCRSWLGWTAQPTLVAGHVNWIALRQLGTLMPLLSWRDRRAGLGFDPSAAEPAGRRRENALWRTTTRSLYGTRQYMEILAARGDDPPWARSLVDQIGKIQDLDLLKTTLVHEYLAACRTFAGVLEATRGKTRRVEAFEEALGRTLPVFEDEWRAWLLGPERGLVQRLREGAAAEDPLQRRVLEEIARVRRAAVFPMAPTAQIEVWLDEELSQGAKRHAEYLVRHPEQKGGWPAAHDEYPDREGFTPEGAWAGGHSVIHIGRAADAVDTWMGTFYHRLPLLDPGLLGIGFGNAGDVAVADVLSLVGPWNDETWIVWPPDGARDVALSFAPELPLPVPGRDVAELGFPITLQVYGRELEPDTAFELTLRRGGPRGEEVPCFQSTPLAPLNPELVPPGAFCLIPREPLRAGTRYHVTVQRVSPRPTTLQWSFETGSGR